MNCHRNLLQQNLEYNRLCSFVSFTYEFVFMEIQFSELQSVFAWIYSEYESERNRGPPNMSCVGARRAP